jgi:glycosyltransferase involved in cell wall biosynthesis
MRDTSPESLQLVSVPDLIVILPVYNEEEIIAEVAAEWLDVLDGMAVPYRLQLCNDGSTDGTPDVLDGLSHRSLEIHHTRNRGHGPTILRAYRSAAERAAWVFQCDSDGQIPAAAFPEFWKKRLSSDLVIGTRIHRQDGRIRNVISACLRFATLCLFGRGIPDVNCPYRLMRSEAFRPFFDQAPEDTFAPNVLLSAYAIRKRLRILNLPVSDRVRQTGEVSIRGWSLLKAVLKATRQTLAFRFSGQL